MWSTSTGLPLVRSGTFAAQPPPLRVELTQEISGFGIRGFLTRSTRLPEVRTKLGSQQHIHLHSDPSLASRRALTPLARMAGRLVSSGTLGFCFIFCFLFSYGGTFTHVFRPMQGSPPLHRAHARGEPLRRRSGQVTDKSLHQPRIRSSWYPARSVLPDFTIELLMTIIIYFTLFKEVFSSLSTKSQPR